MKEKFNQWLAGCALAPGLMGGGLRLLDGTCLTQSFEKTCSPERLDEALRCLGDSLPSLAAHGLVARWQTWNFDKGHMRLAERPDGLLVGLVVRPDSPAAQNLDLLTEEFLALDLAA